MKRKKKLVCQGKGRKKKCPHHLLTVDRESRRGKEIVAVRIHKKKKVVSSFPGSKKKGEGGVSRDVEICFKSGAGRPSVYEKNDFYGEGEGFIRPFILEFRLRKERECRRKNGC